MAAKKISPPYKGDLRIIFLRGRVDSEKLKISKGGLRKSNPEKRGALPAEIGGGLI